MKKTIRLLALIMSLILTVSLMSACGKGDEDTKKPSGDTSGDSANIEFLVDPEDYRGTTVTYVTWKDPASNEDGEVIKKFEEKYGIKVDIQLIGEGSYVSEIASSIASGKQGDVYFQSNTFPGALSVMQPLDAAKINYKDPIWRQDLLKTSTIDGHPYLLDTVGNVWSETNILVYNKKIFEDNNLNSPADYYEAGKWTWEAFRECCKQVKALGKEYRGAAIISDAALGSTGSSIFTFENQKMNVTVNDKLYDVMSFLSQMNADGLVTLDNSIFADGKTGMAITNCFALKKTGYFPSFDSENLGATYLPRWGDDGEQYQSGIYRGWGLIKGAKNPVAAGIFLREYLDVNNYNLEKTFHSNEVATFFFKITSDTTAKTIYSHDIGMVSATGMGEAYFNDWAGYSPSQIRGQIDKNLNVMKSMANKANELVEKERKWLAEEYK